MSLYEPLKNTGHPATCILYNSLAKKKQETPVFSRLSFSCSKSCYERAQIATFLR